MTQKVRWTIDAIKKKCLLEKRSFDLIILCEGGEEPDLDVSLSDFSTLDEVFWENVFKKYSSKKNVVAISYGSKNTLNEYDKDMKRERSEGVIIARDKDHDFHSRSNKIPWLIHTYGYSLENDVISIEFIQHYLKKYIITSGKVDSIYKDIEKAVHDFDSRMELPTKFDIHHKGAFINKKSCLHNQSHITEKPKTSPPSINASSFKAMDGTQLPSDIMSLKVVPSKDTHGKTWLTYCCLLCRYFINTTRNKKSKFQNDIQSFACEAISDFRFSSLCSSYYKKETHRVIKNSTLFNPPNHK